MVKIQWRWQTRRQIWTRLKQYISWKTTQAVLTFQSITYNEHMNGNYIFDILISPIIWFVDNFAGCLGKVFVFCVTVLTSMIVFTAYWVGIPYWWQISPIVTVFLIFFGNWLLLNIIFHYFMGVVTKPGFPPEDILMSETASICKKCILPKPPRTHHCSVCDCCIMGMDHHCPWLNNCVGYFNARYFFLYMVYMVAGILFLIVFGIDLGYKVIWLNDTGGIIPNNDPELVGHPVRINKSGAIVPIHDIAEYDENNAPRIHHLPIPPITEAQRIAAHPVKKKAVWFTACTIAPTVIALTLLVIMHAKNISKGETSVESHINAVLRKTHKSTFKNPYDLGVKKNWKLFLGLTQGRTFFWHILLPSRHKPTGNGLFWHTVHNVKEDWP